VEFIGINYLIGLIYFNIISLEIQQSKSLKFLKKNFRSIDGFSVGIEGISFSLISASCCILTLGCASIRFYHWYL